MNSKIPGCLSLKVIVKVIVKADRLMALENGKSVYIYNPVICIVAEYSEMYIHLLLRHNKKKIQYHFKLIKILNTFIILQKIAILDECCSFSTQRTQHIKVFIKVLSIETVNISNIFSNKKYLLSNHHIRRISAGSRDCWKFSFSINNSNKLHF